MTRVHSWQRERVLLFATTSTLILGVYPASYPMNNMGYFLGSKADDSLPSIIKV